MVDSLRFGRALSRLRNRHAAELRSEARATIKHNLKNYKFVPRNTKDDKKWIKQANLGPVLDYLS